MKDHKYHHIGLITTTPQKDEEYHDEFNFYASGYFESLYGIELLRFDDDSPLHPLIKSVPHIAFVVNDINDAIKNKKVIQSPLMPREGMTVCFIEVDGAPVEFIQFHKPECEVWPNNNKFKVSIGANTTTKDFLKIDYHHFGISNNLKRNDEVYLKDYKLFCTDHESNPYGLQWMRYEQDCKLPQSVKEISHVAFQVNNLYKAIKGRKVIIKPNSPSEEVLVAFIEENGIPIEFIQIN